MPRVVVWGYGNSWIAYRSDGVNVWDESRWFSRKDHAESFAANMQHTVSTDEIGIL